MSDSSTQPAWVSTLHPAWCDLDHRETDLPGDHIHSSVGEAVPAIARDATWDGDAELVYRHRPASIALGLHRR
ncbi:MAG: hypothetical protein ACTH0V_00475 [Microbacteriaceae bacterium]